MFRSKAFTIIGIISLLLIFAAIAIQLMELDYYGDLDPLIQQVFNKK